MQPADKPNPLASGFHSRGVLPHLKREGGTYFVTFRLAGTLPREVLLRFEQEREEILQHALAAKRPLTWHEQEALFRWYSSRVDKYLDEGHGECYLGRKDCADLVAGALRYFDRQRYELRAWVVMPNHVHVVVQPTPPHTLSDILQAWKSFTSHRAQTLLPKRVVPFWQDESYDHLVRDDDDLHRLAHYTIVNPVSARLCARPEHWPWSSARMAPAVPPVGSSAGLSQVKRAHSATKPASSGETPLEPAGEDACAT